MIFITIKSVSHRTEYGIAAVIVTAAIFESLLLGKIGEFGYFLVTSWETKRKGGHPGWCSSNSSVIQCDTSDRELKKEDKYLSSHRPEQSLS